MVGNATRKAGNQAFSQIVRMPSTRPMLNREITIDMMPDMISAIRKANTKPAYFFGIKLMPPLMHRNRANPPARGQVLEAVMIPLEHPPRNIQ